MSLPVDSAVVLAKVDASLPLWANLVVGLVGGGAIGGVVSALVQTGARRREDWRSRIIAASDEFSESYWTTYQGLSAVLDLNYARNGELLDNLPVKADESSMVDDAREPLGETLRRWSRLRLLFGAESRPTLEAREAYHGLRRCANNLQGEPDYPFTDAHDAHEHLKKSEEAHDRFAAAARQWAVKGTTRGPIRDRIRKKSDDDD